MLSQAGSSQAARRGPRVAFCSPAAAALGVRPGQTLAEAGALLEAQGRRGRAKPVIEEHDPQADLAALQELAGWCQRFTPHVGVEEPAGRKHAPPPDSLLLDITGCAPLRDGKPPRGGEPALVEQIALGLRARRLRCRLAVADTLGAAWAVAHAAEDAERGTEVALVPPGQQAAALDRLPVASLRLAPSAVEALRDLGLERVAQLRALPRASLPSRFGKEVLTQLDRALGTLPETFVTVRLEEPIAAEWRFEPPAEGRPALEFAVRRLIERVAKDLAARREAASRLTLRLAGPDGFEADVPVGLARPSASAGHLLDVVLARLERVRLPAGLSHVRIEATATAKLETRQRELFDSRSQEDEEHAKSLASLVDRFVGRLGEDRVLKPRLVADAQPEKSCEFDPVTGANAPTTDATGHDVVPSRATHGAGRLFRPLRLLPEPEPITVISTVPDGPPRRLLWTGGDEELICCHGPERIETGWWRNDDVRRDYYRVEAAGGGWLWLFQDRRTGRWYRHGAFE